MPPIYRIHPGIGVARLGNSPDEICITPEEPAALPIDCDAQGSPRLSPDGETELRVQRFKDGSGRIKRQAARFQVYVYDDESPEGRPLKLGDPVYGGGNHGVLIDIQWRVHLANKKAVWYEFKQLEGEHGYAPNHPRRNAAIEDPEARQRLIIDPGPRAVNCTDSRAARFDRDGNDVYAPTFPPKLEPCSIDTLGEMKTDAVGRLLVLGGHGSSGSYRFNEFGQPRIDAYANNDGWFDDTSDGPVMARLVMYSKEVGKNRYVDVESPSWCIVGYPAYVPEIPDMITMDEVLEDVYIRQFAARTDLFGEAGTFDEPQSIDRGDPNALALWRAGRLRWNPEYRPWFYRDIWAILFRPDQYSYLTSILGQSNFPHNQSGRGNFDPARLGTPSMLDREELVNCEERCVEKHKKGEMFVSTLYPAFKTLEQEARIRLSAISHAPGEDLIAEALGITSAGHLIGGLRKALAGFAAAVGDQNVQNVEERPSSGLGSSPGDEPDKAPLRGSPGEGHGSLRRYIERWRTLGASPTDDYKKATDKLEAAVGELLHLGGAAPRRKRAEAGKGERETPEMIREELKARLHDAVSDHLKKYHTGRLLEECGRQCVAKNTIDPHRAYRQYVFDLLRKPGEENRFAAGGKVESRTHNLPLMPLLAGDNPISNTLPSKFLRMTDYQFFLLRQWAQGLFYNEVTEGWGQVDPWNPYGSWKNRTGRDLDRGVLSNVLGGAFCPGGEAGWIMRNPAIYESLYRVKADPTFAAFRQTAAQANTLKDVVPEADYLAYTDEPLSQDDDFARGLQPGDLTKHMALPWQADFNECTVQDIDVTYEDWNAVYPKNGNDKLMEREARVWQTLWWPAHRPIQTFELIRDASGQPSYRWVDWSRGIPGTNAGDLKMVTEWWRLGFVRKNPDYPSLPDVKPTELPPPDPPPYISVERTERKGDKHE